MDQHKKFQYTLAHRHATWLELFFDLVFVACIGIITHNLAHTHHGHIDSNQVWLFPVQFLVIWWIWMSHTMFANRFDTDRKYHRLANLTIMFLMIAMASFLGDSLFESYGMFILFYLVIRVVLVSLYFHTTGILKESKKLALNSGLIIVIGTLISVLSFFFSSPFREIVLCIGILFEIISFVLISHKKNYISIHKEHFVERIGLFSIILLGESVISLTSSLRGIEWNMMNIMAAIAGFITIGLIWWIYYDSFHVMEKIKAMKNGFALAYSHIFLAMGFILLANVIRHSILNDLEMEDFRVLAILGMCFFYIGKQTVYFTFLPPYRKPILLNTMVCVLITVGSTFLPKIEYAIIGISIGMLYYTLANFKFTLSKNVSKYLQD